MSALNAETIAEVFGDLVSQLRWVCWRYEERKGRPTKVPMKPGGAYAKTDTPSTWTTFARCAAYADATPGVGVGIVFNGDGVVGIDLDKCRDIGTGELTEDARRIVADFASYTEVTPSGAGLHILCRGALPGGASGTRRGNIEAYSSGRFFTVTGAALPDLPDEIVDAQPALERLWSKLGAHETARPAGGAGETDAAYQAHMGPDTPWRRLNTAALAKLGAWVPELFGDAAKFVKGKGGYRIAAADLERDLEEDLSIMPHGIRDWGMGDLGPDGKDYGREGKRTPVDLVLEFGGAPNELTAATWLAERLGKSLADFGFEAKPGKKRAKRRAAEELEAGPEPGNGDERWSELLHRTERGEVRDVIVNAVTILRADHRFAGRLRWNQLLEAVEAEDLPWRKGGWQEWADADDLQLAAWCQERHAYLKPPTVANAVQIVARDQMHHPVRERLDALTWDGVPRLGSWLSTYLGVAASSYTKAVGRAWMISAVARAYQPGCKVDTALILEGAQGAGKSQAAGLLALDQSLFTDQIADLGTKDSGQDLRGKWVVELAELAAMRRPEIERVKAFMSRREDHYRPSYGRRSQDYPRQCVFVGTTNSESYLADETGGRRFWPVKVGTIELEKLRCDRKQLWAEAVVAYCKDERWWLSSEIEGAAREEQEARRIEDPWEAAIARWLIGQGRASVDQVLRDAIGMPLERQDQRARNRVAAVLKGAGWQPTRRRVDGELRRFYEPTPQTRNTPDEGDQAADAASDLEQGVAVPGAGARPGTEKSSNGAPVPGVPGVPGMSATRAHAGAHARPALSESGWNTRNTRNSASAEPATTWAAQAESVPPEAEDGPASETAKPAKRVLFAAWKGPPQEATIVRDSALSDGAPKVYRVLLREIALGVDDGLPYAHVQFADPPKPGRRHDGAIDGFITRRGRGRMAVLKGWPPIKLGTWPEIEQAVATRADDVMLDCLGDVWP